ncbi:hypothetical protein [Nocardia gipuzkoensis]
MDTLARFTLVERGLIAHAATHYAVDFYGGPFDLDIEDTARYITEGYLSTVSAVHGRSAVSEAVIAYIRRYPDALHHGEAHRDGRSQESIDQWWHLITAAGEAYKIGKFNVARKFVERAETVEPARSVAGYRHKIDEATPDLL